MRKSSWRCYKKAWLALSVAITMVLMLSDTGPAFGQDPAQALYGDAMSQYEWGDYDQAMAAFEEIIAQYPASDLADDVQYMLGQCYVQLERYDDVIFAFYTAAYKYPQSNRADDALIALAGHLYSQDYMPQALDAYEQLVKDYPQSEHAAYAQTCIGWLYGGTGDVERAKAELEKVIADYPDSPSAEIAKASLTELGPVGDGNGDGRCTEVDALVALKMAVGLQTPDVATMDVNGDGQVTEVDALQILKWAVAGGQCGQEEE